MKKLLILIIFLGAFLRYYEVNWDSFKAFHPDERNISWAVTRIHFFDQLNPKFFAYGGLPIYLYRAIGEGVVAVSRDPVWLRDWGHIATFGRCVSATLSTISIFLIYLVGAAYFSPAVGMLSAAFLAFSPWAIREAHFQTTETMLVFFLLAMTYVSRRIMQKLTIRSIVQLGLLWGLALSAKTTSILFGIIPITAIWFPHLLKNISKKLLFTFLLCTISSCVFFLFSPYTILDITHFRESMTYESGVALGRFTVPYTLQFLHTTPYLYQIETMLWQAGPLAIIGLIGLILLFFSVIPDLIGDLPFWKKTNTDSRLRGNDKKIIFLIFPLLYFAWVGSWFAKFSRYNVPFLPFITIAAAWLMVKIHNKFLYVVVGGITICWCLANFTIYLRPQTRFAATEWMFTHIPSGANIYTEHWNDGLPLDLPEGISYKRELLTVYDADNDVKKTYYTDKLATGDFIILSTRRIWATMPQLGAKYPLTKLFYERLLNGTLGYKEVATFTSYPQLFGIAINDDVAEESIQVFDHPTVRIFQNTEHLSKEEIYQRLMFSMGS